MAFTDANHARRLAQRLHLEPDIRSIAKEIGANLADDEEYLIVFKLFRERRYGREYIERSEEFTRQIQRGNQHEGSTDS